jgi:hypothetical protein
MGRLDGDHRKPAAPSRRTQRSGLEVIDKRRGSDSHLAPPLFVHGAAGMPRNAGMSIS